MQPISSRARQQAVLRFLKRAPAAWIAAAFLAMGAPQPGPVQQQDVIDHLEQTIAWYRHLQTADQSSMDLLERQGLHQASLKALQLAFDYARASAALAASDAQQAQGGTSGGAANLQQAATRANERVAGIQARIGALEQAIVKAPARERPSLEAQRRELGAQLDLAKEIQNTLQSLLSFSGNLGASGAAAGLTGQIDELERSIPEARHERKAAAAPANPPATQPAQAAAPHVFRPESRGIIGLITDLFTIRGNRVALNDLKKETDALAAQIDKLRAPLLAETRASIRRADEIVNAAPAQKPEEAAAAQKELNGLTVRFRQLSTAMLPLSEQGIAAGGARSFLQESITDLNDDFSRGLRYLLLRAVMLGIAIAAILFFSELWRRATFRYVGDSRRRRQFLMLRRVVVAVAVIVTVVLGFVTEFGSLATYAGFVTAGLAVALQNPILSVVAYFFLIGRYGIRVGDRVTIGGVTGEVIEIGLVRIYLMELGPEMHSTGRVVVFSNAVVFQPAALYKQMPGLDYVWHTVTLTLAPGSDFQLAETKLNAAVDSVYEQYRDHIERQHRSIEKAFDVDVSTPQPESRLRFTDTGVQYTVRYPAELKKASSTDDHVMKALYEAIAKEPDLKFAPAGTPKVQLAA